MLRVSLWRTVLFVMVAFCLGEAWAQDTPSATTYFQAYEDALQRGDLPAAETAAAQALAVSEQRSGDSGRTAVLAFNLARVRLSLGQAAQARAPAERAYDLSRTQGAASGLDPLMSRVLWGRVRVASEGLGASDFLLSALEDAEGREDLLQDRYDAADQLGLASLQAMRHIIARRAWALAAETAGGAPYDADFARGRALTYEGIATSLQTLMRDVTPRSLLVREARERFAEAHPLLQPFATASAAADGALTHPQELYAQLLGWDATLRSLQVTALHPGANRVLPSNPTTFEGAPVCSYEGDASGVQFPARQYFEGQLGTVVLRLTPNDDGSLTGLVAAGVGDEAFEQNVRRASAPWVFRPSAANEGACRTPPVLYLTIVFGYRP